MEAQDWPEFSTPTPIAGKRSWTAVFDSYDQRNDDCYYLITIDDGGASLGSFMAQVGLWWVNDDWTSPAFRDRLQKEIHAVAVSGKANTTYTGSLVSWSGSKPK